MTRVSASASAAAILFEGGTRRPSLCDRSKPKGKKPCRARDDVAGAFVTGTASISLDEHREMAQAALRDPKKRKGRKGHGSFLPKAPAPRAAEEC
jgi:hypothetical protein